MRVPGYRLPVLALLAGAVPLVLAGCFGAKKADDEHCNDVAEYQSSRSVPGVKVPDGLVTPGKGSGYAVPAPTAEAQVQGAACLARPPGYFRKEAPPAAAATGTPPAGQPAGQSADQPADRVAPPAK